MKGSVPLALHKPCTGMSVCVSEPVRRKGDRWRQQHAL